ncbi:hypothetical protein [Otariodibacter oris]|uniref:Uncharacterized protein n=1 Tax=Otariodibacter oris TaxID=1032623 RepID=A0A420XIZ5_9PAST|nr:hypothetical protein [Otariodibacter oris]QGM80772.1 hypothetical protein A6A10_04820 [Otariodibacter oris]RKR77060.1 hypothetical protein DES31_0379 [Otariodibacter oris]
MTILPLVYDNIFPLNEQFKTVKDYFEYFIFCANTYVLDQPLRESKERKEWLKHYPDISNFPKTLKYIENENSVSLSEVENELSSISLYLSKGEILFHSGQIPEGINLQIGEEFQLKNIFSATLDPYIANAHDSNDDTYWYITINSDNIRCFPVPDREDDSTEYEVIILDSPKVKITNIKKGIRNSKWDKSPPTEYQDIEKTIVYVEFTL